MNTKTTGSSSLWADGNSVKSRLAGQLYVMPTPAPKSRFANAAEHVSAFLAKVKRDHPDVIKQVERYRARISSQRKGQYSTIGRAIDFVPERVRVMMKFSFPFARTAAAGPSNLDCLPSNLFDIGAAQASGVPVPYTDWTDFFNQWVVMKSRTRVSVAGRSTTSPLATTLYYVPAPQGLTTMPLGASQPHAVSALGGIVGAPPLKLDSGWVNHAAFVGMTDDEFRNNSGFFGIVATSTAPTDTIYASLYAQDGAGVSTSITFDTLWTFDLVVEFFDRIVLS